MSDPALHVMEQWQLGAATGDWSGLLALFDRDVTFHVPVSGFSGQQHGVEAATRFFAHLTAVLRAELVVTATLTGVDRTGFEVAVTGTMHGEPFAQALCLVFEVTGGQVRAFREYLAWPGGLPIDRIESSGNEDDLADVAALADPAVRRRGGRTGPAGPVPGRVARRHAANLSGARAAVPAGDRWRRSLLPMPDDLSFTDRWAGPRARQGIRGTLAPGRRSPRRRDRAPA